ncbi:hypothetical protein FZEAL_7675 [Fusarium zealandicum]|uniref:NmrA-like domain-containing protein n=1 Tax=Fusarium zealandicum TaxID=1053134 RepID=A0A8H4XIM2_9HYPO|nr:hypothetical protein FZEAL_7675 [Fusarium zealandicum]
MAHSKQVVAIAGSGNIAQYLAEEFTRDQTHKVIVISRTDQGFFRTLGITSQKLDQYSKDNILPILDQTNATVLVSTLHTDDPESYTSVHGALLEACRGSKFCKRMIPSEFLGNSRDFRNVPRGIQRARHSFRSTLADQSDVQWTRVNGGWLADYFVQLPDGTRSYIKPFPQGWPIDLQQKTVRLIGTGDEPVSWTAARDIAKAVVKLVSYDDWDSHTWVFGELGTWNQAIEKVERFHGVELKVIQLQQVAILGFILTMRQRSYVTRDTLDQDLAREEEDAVWYTATIDEWSLTGATAVPHQEALQQRDKYFKDVHFRNIDDLLQDSKSMEII